MFLLKYSNSDIYSYERFQIYANAYLLKSKSRCVQWDLFPQK